MNNSEINYLLKNFIKSFDHPLTESVLGGFKVIFESEDEVEESDEELADDINHLYHITYVNRLNSIAEEGLVANQMASIGSSQYDEHRKDKVFLCDTRDVDEWYEIAEQWAIDQSDNYTEDGFIPVVLEISYFPDDIYVDNEARDEGKYESYYIKESISPDAIKVWDGSKWISLSYELPLNLNNAVDEEGQFKQNNPFRTINKSYNPLNESVGNTNYIQANFDKLSEKSQDILDAETYPARLYQYLSRTNQDVFTIPKDPKNKELLINIMWPHALSLHKSIDSPKITQRFDTFDEYVGKSKDELDQIDQEEKEERIQHYNKLVETKIHKINLAKEIISKKVNVEFDIPSTNKIIDDVIDSVDSRDSDTDEGDDVVVYIYKNDRDSGTGMEVNIKTGKIELYEANDEANEATVDAVNALTVDPEAYVLVYTAQNATLCDSIYGTSKVPTNMFFSPDKKYAYAYLDQTRDLLSFQIQYKYIQRNSNVDWKSRSEAPVKNVKYV